jgi:glycosyltransferase involved in cell wall biosynthesis
MIDYYGHWGQYVDGIGRFARRQARTLATRLPVTVRLWPEQWLQAEALAEVAGMFEPRPRSYPPAATDVSVTTIILQEKKRDAPTLRSRAVLYTMFERSLLDQQFVDLIAKAAAQIWVPCRHNAAVLVEQGVPQEMVRVVPFSYDDDPKAAGEVRASAQPASGTTRRFYTMGTWQLRKNHDVLIGAFLSAFGPDDDVTLLIKTRHAHHPKPQEMLDSWLNRFGLKWSAAEARRRIQIVDEEASQDDIRMMHAMHNIYVSASHGEGWEMPAFDAVLSGNTLVHVPYGATDDWAPSSSIRVPYGMASIPSWFCRANGWPSDAEWAWCSVDALAEALQRATPSASVDADMSAYTVERVAALMHRNLEELL